MRGAHVVVATREPCLVGHAGLLHRLIAAGPVGCRRLGKGDALGALGIDTVERGAHAGGELIGALALDEALLDGGLDLFVDAAGDAGEFILPTGEEVEHLGRRIGKGIVAPDLAEELLARGVERDFVLVAHGAGEGLGKLGEIKNKIEGGAGLLGRGGLLCLQLAQRLDAGIAQHATEGTLETLHRLAALGHVGAPLGHLGRIALRLGHSLRAMVAGEQREIAIAVDAAGHGRRPGRALAGQHQQAEIFHQGIHSRAGLRHGGIAGRIGARHRRIGRHGRDAEGQVAHLPAGEGLHAEIEEIIGGHHRHPHGPELGEGFDAAIPHLDHHGVIVPLQLGAEGGASHARGEAAQHLGNRLAEGLAGAGDELVVIRILARGVAGLDLRHRGRHAKGHEDLLVRKGFADVEVRARGALRGTVDRDVAREKDIAGDAAA